MGSEREFQEVVACGHLERVLRFNDQHSGCGEGKDFYFRSISTFNVIYIVIAEVKMPGYKKDKIFLFTNQLFKSCH